MSDNHLLTKPKYQWTEIALFIGCFTTIAMGYLTFQQYQSDQIASAAAQRANCGWSPLLPVTKPQTTGTNLFANPSMEQTILGDQPQNWTTDSWGHNIHQFDYIQNDGHTGQASLKVEMGGTSDGDAKWEFNSPITAEPDQFYVFQNYSKSDTETALVAEIGLPDNNWQYIDLGIVPASTDWRQNTYAFTTPAQAQTVDVFQIITNPGYLQTDDYYLSTYAPASLPEGMVSLTFDDGATDIYTNALPLLDKYHIKSTQFVVTDPIFQDYNSYYVNQKQLQEFIDHGHEIGSHTASHQHLANVSPSQSQDELVNAQQGLYQLIGHTAANFATPYGEYDSRVIDQAKQYYCSHRSTDTGFNSPDNFDLYNIRVQNVLADTPVEDIYTWMNFAAEHKVWLVLVFHEVGYGSGKYNYTPEDLNKVLSFIDHTDIKTTTMAEGILIMQKSQVKLGLADQ